ncbi:MAG: hypothetical protein HY865_12185 [Chloroflexi bacterium]|nr:hypothetical protein [Chloroflexota bacterium]
MNRRFLILIVLTVTLLGACAPTPVPTPTVDVIGTMSMELASAMMTQTAAAYSPTPLPSPTFTAMPPVTETPTLPTEPVATPMPKVMGQAPCYTGPGSSYPLTSNITSTKRVELIGVGSVPGWYVIKNPYFYSPCWIAAENLVFEPGFDVSVYPTITP